MNNKPEILIVDDDKSVLTSLLILFRHHGFEPTIESDPQKIKSLLSSHKFEAVVLDMNFRRGHNEGKEGIFWLDTIKNIQPDQNVILITAYGDIDLAVEAVKKGAADFILKPWDNEALIAKVKSVIESKNKAKTPEREEYTSILIGKSEASKEVQSLVRKVSESSVSVMITGENGVGKMLVAREIHYLYTVKATKPVVIDFTKEIEEETVLKTIKEYKGKTLVLNHIELMTNQMQENIYRLVNEFKELKVISTCGQLNDLNDFHEELKQKLNLIHIGIRPLRDRKEDIKPLSIHFLKTFAEKYDRKASEITAEALNKLHKHSWLGNIKELKHCLERAVILSEEASIDNDLIKLDNNIATTVVNSSGTLNLSEIEKETIIKAIEGCNGNITKASKKLGITRTALYRRMEKYDI